MSAAIQIYYAKFDEAFLKLPPPIRARVQSDRDRLAPFDLSSSSLERLDSFPRAHGRLPDHLHFRSRAKHDSPTRHRSPARHLSSDLNFVNGPAAIEINAIRESRIASNGSPVT